MPRSLDHLVIAARDLHAVAERYRDLGFKVGPRNRHPWGTENHIIQFDGAFLELVGLGEGFAPPAADDPSFPFAGFIADFLTRREGLAMVALRSHDAEADRRAFAAAGWGDGPRFDFARRGRRGDREVEVAFSLAFARPAAFAGAGFFVSQHHFPENFWDAAAQIHPNGATGVAELVLAHSDPGAALAFLSDFLGQAAEPGADALRFELPQMQVVCLTPERQAAHGGPLPLQGFVAARIASRDGSSFWID